MIRQLFLIAVFLLSACAETFCFPLNARNDLGKKQRIEGFADSEFFFEFPQRIISLGPSITEELYLLGAQNKIVGVTVYCRKPAQAREKEKVGTAVEVNVEKITALEPDLIIATSLTSPKSIEKLKNLGIDVVIFPATESFPRLCDQFLELAKLIGKEKEAQIILKEVRSEVETIRKSVEILSKPKVIVQVGAKPLWIATRDSFMNDFIELAGGENIGPQGLNGCYSREKVLELNPDVIIITTMGIIGDDEKTLWQKYTTLSAVKNNRIYIVDSDKFCSPTPVSFVNTLKEAVTMLHPENE
jgi:ABC-type Fe3+-hydroxamate transport system substrate-binding protein